MELGEAQAFLEKVGYKVDTLQFIPEGTSHDIFRLRTVQGVSLIARFEKKNQEATDGIRRDFHYNGRISLEREAFLCDLVRTKAQLPAPFVEGIYSQGEARALIVQDMSGKQWNAFIQESNYSRSAYLRSLEFLAQDLAKAQQVAFSSYGDILPETIEPKGISTFPQRLEQILQLKLKREEQKKALSSAQFREVKSYLEVQLQSMTSVTKKSVPTPETPVLVLADLHPPNFLVDEKGKPSGYVDLEFCQAGHPSLDFYMLDFQFFNYFDRSTMELSRTTFFKAFHEAGGNYNPDDPLNFSFHYLLGLGRFLTCVTGYHGLRDGQRDTWSERCKDLLFQAIKTGEVDYLEFAEIMREKTKQPTSPLSP